MNKSIIKKFGFYHDQEGIISRFLRESKAWETHLMRTKNFILSSSKNKKKTKALILGTGWLLDIPYVELSELFDDVVFIDIKHPRQIVHKLAIYGNIRLIETDISGLIEPVYQALNTIRKNKRKTSLLDIVPVFSDNFLFEIQNADYVVSVNLLNQLDILICDYILKKGLFNENELIDFRRYIQHNHIKLLPAEKSVLITDYEEINLDKDNQIVKRKNLIHITLPTGKNSEKWIWEFDLQKTYHSKMLTHFKVAALEL